MGAGQEALESRVPMALFGMVWLMRVRASMQQCTKCGHAKSARVPPDDAPAPAVHGPSAGEPHTKRTLKCKRGSPYCEVHGYSTPGELQVHRTNVISGHLQFYYTYIVI